MTYPGELVGQGLTRFPVLIEEEQITSSKFFGLSVEIIEIAQPRSISDILMHFTKSAMGRVVQPEVMPTRRKLRNIEFIAKKGKLPHDLTVDNFLQFRFAVNAKLMAHGANNLEFSIAIFMSLGNIQFFHRWIFGIEQAKQCLLRIRCQKIAPHGKPRWLYRSAHAYVFFWIAAADLPQTFGKEIVPIHRRQSRIDFGRLGQLTTLPIDQPKPVQKACLIGILFKLRQQIPLTLGPKPRLSRIDNFLCYIVHVKRQFPIGKTLFACRWQRKMFVEI